MSYTVYISPISGGAFPVQLGLLCELYIALRCITPDVVDKNSYSPDLMLGSSGGNIASYIALGANFTPLGIRRICSMLYKEIFITPWIPYLPTWLVIPFTGSVYRAGYGAGDIFNTLFNSVSIQSTEVWSGTYNSDTKSSQMFCNRYEEDAVIKSVEFNKTCALKGAMRLKYLKGKVDKIAKITLASASIPYLTVGQMYENNLYSDGGVMYASPLGVFTDEIRRHIQTTGKWLSMYYFCSYNMENTRLKSDFGALESMLDASSLKDRDLCVEILHSLSVNVEYTHYPMLCNRALQRIISSVKDKTHYALYLYPHCNYTIKMTSFCVEDILAVIDKTSVHYGAHLWRCV
jgi:hypothetical protein